MIHPLPSITVRGVYSKFFTINCPESPGPDTPEEFAREVSIPLCDVINSSLSQSVYPSRCKEATALPTTKSFRPAITELRPTSLTAQLSKICEQFAPTMDLG